MDEMKNNPGVPIRTDFPNNSKYTEPIITTNSIDGSIGPNQRKERKSPAPVVKGEVKQYKKRPIGIRIKEFFTKDVKTSKNDIFKQIIEPRMKDILWDVGQKVLSTFIWPDGSRNLNIPRPNDRQFNSMQYHNISSYSRNVYPQANNNPNVPSAIPNLPFQSFENKMDADNVLFELREQIKQYGNATVNDYCTASCIQTVFTYEHWGWTTLETAKVLPYYNEWYVDLPRPVYIG